MFTRVLAGDVQLLFVSPESIMNNKHFQGMLLSQHYKKHLVAVAVDEAHCDVGEMIFVLLF